MSASILTPQRVRTFEITQTVTGYTPGPITEWPANMQDAIYKALDKKAREVRLPLAIVASAIKKDHGYAQDGSQDRWFAHIVASEVVARDTRFELGSGLHDPFLAGFRGSKQ